MLSSCSYLLQNDEDALIGKLDKFLQPSQNNFTEDQKQSAYELCFEIAKCENQITQKQKEFLNDIENRFVSRPSQEKWA